MGQGLMPDYTQRPWLYTKRFSHALDLFRDLNPVDGILGGTLKGPPYIFRGCALAETYDLVPSALRRTARLLHGLSDTWHRGPLLDVANQILAEANTLRHFFDIADRRGLPLPEDTQELRSLLPSMSPDSEYLKDVSAGECKWPPRRLLSLMAIAQHHGASTRLLDWTWDPYVAAYFAASGARRQQKQDIAVWALNDVYIHAKRDYRSYTKESNSSSRLDEVINVVTAPGSGNRNLQAQKGLFLVHRIGGIDLESETQRASYDQILAEELRLGEERDPVLFRFTLPVEQAPELLRMLSISGVNASTVFPGYDGVTGALFETDAWPDQNQWDARFRGPISKRANEFREEVRAKRGQLKND